MSTLRELYRHNDWAWRKVVDAARTLTDEQLDRHHDLGFESLRETLRHLYAAEHVWFQRWLGRELTELPPPGDLTGVDDIDDAERRLVAARNAFLDQVDDEGFRTQITFTNTQGKTYSDPLGDHVLHVVNHGVHHRAQAANILRHSGVKPAGLDYLYMRLERPTVQFDAAMLEGWRGRGFDVLETPEPAAELDVDTLLEYFHYSDWATARIMKAAASLTDAQLDQEFEIGLGTLRKTLCHIRDAEEWWHNNWTAGPTPFSNLPPDTSLSALSDLIASTIERRDAFIRSCTPADLLRPLTIEVLPDVTITFRVGEGMLQLPPHGTHHRAQAAAFLRRLGAERPTLDYIVCLRERAGV